LTINKCQIKQDNNMAVIEVKLWTVDDRLLDEGMAGSTSAHPGDDDE